MGWSGAFPELCRKRPTANLVSRKVLTPLLSQMCLCIAFQTVVFIQVRKQPWYALAPLSFVVIGADQQCRFIPPVVNHEKSNVKNSENTALFLVSCFEYIFAGIILNGGPPFRTSMVESCKFHLSPVQPASFCHN